MAVAILPLVGGAPNHADGAGQRNKDGAATKHSKMNSRHRRSLIGREASSKKADGPPDDDIARRLRDAISGE